MTRLSFPTFAPFARAFSAWTGSGRARTAGLRADSSAAASAIEAILALAVTVASVGLVWNAIKPLGPLGRWQPPAGVATVADPLVLTRFDPFFRSASASATTVTSLALKLFGVRIGAGGASAIVATPDGVQSSYAVGDEIAPGVRLREVAFDHVVLDRGGTREQLFLDQSVTAPVAGASTTASALPSTASATAALASEIGFMPRNAGGAITGVTVAPQGSGQLFSAAGLQPGDVVTQINGEAVRSGEDATRALSTAPGGQATLVVERAGKTVTLTTGVPR